MAVPSKVLKFLEKAKIKYDIIKHKPVYTAFDKTQTLKVSPAMVGKTLVLKLDKAAALVLIPANKNLDKQKLKKSAGAGKIDFLKETWMKKNLKGIKAGQVPPFGRIWKIATFGDRGLLKNPKIILNSGDYNFSIKISPAGLKKLLPDLVIGNFSQSRK